MQYVVCGALSHGAPGQPVRTYQNGEVFETDDAQLAAQLRAAGALKLSAEVTPAEVTQATLSQAQAERDAAISRATDLEAQLQAILSQQQVQATEQPDPNQ